MYEVAQHVQSRLATQQHSLHASGHPQRDQLDSVASQLDLDLNRANTGDLAVPPLGDGGHQSDVEVDLHRQSFYLNEQNAVSDLSVASFPRYSGLSYQDADTLSLSETRIVEPADGALSLSKRRGRHSGRLPDASTASLFGHIHRLDDLLTPRTNSFQGGLVAGTHHTCDPQSVCGYEKPTDGLATDGNHSSSSRAQSRASYYEAQRQAVMYPEALDDFPPVISTLVGSEPSRSAVSSAQDVPGRPLVSRLGSSSEGRRTLKAPNPTAEHYYWDAQHQHLYPLASGQSIPPDSEPITFSAGSYHQVFKDIDGLPLVSSDPLPRANEWIRAQVCVPQCTSFRVENKVCDGDALARLR